MRQDSAAIFHSWSPSTPPGAPFCFCCSWCCALRETTGDVRSGADASRISSSCSTRNGTITAGGASACVDFPAPHGAVPIDLSSADVPSGFDRCAHAPYRRSH